MNREMAIRKVKAAKTADNDILDFVANERPFDFFEHNIGSAFCAINARIELAKRAGKPYAKMQSVLDSLLNTMEAIEAAQSEIAS